MNRPYRYMFVELPDKEVIIAFSNSGAVIHITEEATNHLNVSVIANDDRATIIFDETFEIPPKDNRI